MSKVLVIGIDCAPPELYYEKWINDLPNFKKLYENGIVARMHTTLPPITCPAWMTMMTSHSPGRLGAYGFRIRKSGTYNEIMIANSYYITSKTVWEILSQHGKRSIVLGVPQTYPPKPLKGVLISGFLTPSDKVKFTYPPEYSEKIKKLVGEYKFDVRNFRTEDKERVKRESYEITDIHFKVFKHLLQTEEWDFAMIMEIALDRMNHAFWKYQDPQHRRYTPDHKYKNELLNYAKYLDEKIGEVLEIIPEDTYIFVVSDHGAQRMDGCIAINEWFIKEGYLKLKSYPSGQTRFQDVEVDWGDTIAWGWGGYYARIFLNVKGREPEGKIDKKDYEKVRDEIKQKLSELKDEEGNPLNTLVVRPEEIYPVVRGDAPDLMAFFGDFRWRSIASVGYNTIYTYENDTGPDDAMHSLYGIFVLSGKDIKHQKLDEVNILDIAPTILKLFGIENKEAEGKSIL